MGIRNYKNQGSRDIALGVVSKLTERILPLKLHQVARIKLAQLDATENILELRNMRSLHLEKLKGDRRGFWSIRINKQYRIIFRIEGSHICDVGIEDYH